MGHSKLSMFNRSFYWESDHLDSLHPWSYFKEISENQRNNAYQKTRGMKQKLNQSPQHNYVEKSKNSKNLCGKYSKNKRKTMTLRKGLPLYEKFYNHTTYLFSTQWRKNYYNHTTYHFSTQWPQYTLALSQIFSLTWKPYEN